VERAWGVKNGPNEHKLGIRGSSTTEVSFDDVRVPAENVLGEVNRGWYAAATTLDFERSGVGRIAGGQRTLEQLVDFCRETTIGGVQLGKKPEVRAKLAELAIEHEVGRYLSYRVSWMQASGVVCPSSASTISATRRG